MVEGRGTAPEPLVGRYRLVERLAAGGMGEVWRAHDERMGRDVAVKLLREDLAADPAAVERFRREARTAASLTHPNIARVYDVVDGDRPAIVMELVEGETLGERLAGGALVVDEAVEVGDAVLAALEAAHAAGVVHRDVTPGNVLLSPDGGVKVADFGIARTEQEGTRLTDTGNVIGTAHYLAPEQLHDEPPTPLTDQYAAGLVLYEALTGARPFEAATPAAAALARLHVPPTPLAEHRPEVPEAVVAVVMRALAREPAGRFASVGEMRAALRAAASVPSTSATAAPTGGPAAITVGNLPVAAGTTAVTTNPLPLVVGDGGRRGGRQGGRRGLALIFVASLGLGVLAGLLAAGFAGRDEGKVAGAPTVPTSTSTSTSTVPPCCTVPQLVGLPFDEAQRAASDAGVILGDVETAESDEPAGTVIEQDPAPGGAVAPGTTVDVVVADEDDGHGGRGKGKDDD